MPLLAGLGPLGVPELLIIALIILLVFGVGRLPEVGGAVGKSIREFRKATKDGDGEDTSSASASASTEMSTAGTSGAAASGEMVFCSECGTQNLRDAKFCSQCGHSIGVSVS